MVRAFFRGGRLGVCWATMALALALAAGGCRTSRPEQGHKLVWRTLSRGLSSGLTEPRRQVIREEGAWYRLWSEHAAEMNRVALPPEVSFAHEMVVAVAMGERPTGGYLVEIVDVELQGRTLRVLVGERRPSPGTLQIQRATQPFIFVALPAIRGRIDFRTVSEGSLPRPRGPGGDTAGGSEPRRRSPGREEAPVESPRGATSRER